MSESIKETLKVALRELSCIENMKRFMNSSNQKAGKRGYIRAMLSLENSSRLSIVKNGIRIQEEKFSWDEVFLEIERLVSETGKEEQMCLSDFMEDMLI